MRRVVIEAGRARGVEVERAGESARIDARREVILCGGAINSPQLLMLSGVGPGAELRDLGIEVARDLPGVGSNLMDHLALNMCADPHESPRIVFNYLSCEEDRDGMRTAVRLTREVIRQPAFDPYRGRERFPGDAVHTEEEIDAFVRETGTTNFHAAGTCRMGTDETAVVDPEGRVHGVEGLRVADASVMPRITRGNTNAPCVMIGEKIADHVRGRREPPSNVGFHRSENWENTQRPGEPIRC